MRAQYSVLFFMLCLNISSMLVYFANLPAGQSGFGLSLPIPAHKLAPPMSKEDIETEIGLEDTMGYMNTTRPEAQLNVPILGDLWNALSYFLKMVYWLLDGFPGLVSTFGVPQWIVWALRLPFWFAFGIFVIEFILGRSASD